MFGSWVLEVAIGLIFVFILFSTICAAIREGIEAWTKTRAAYLERGVRELLHDMQGTGLAKQFFEHPLIYSLYAAGEYRPGKTGDKLSPLARGGKLPSYIPTKNFAAAMIDIAGRGPLPAIDRRNPGAGPANLDAGAVLAVGPITAESLRAGIGKMDNERVARALLNALDLAQDDLNKARLNLEAWFDGGMDRVSGWYKRSTQWIVFWLALITAAVMNVDAIGIANFLYQNDTARHAIVMQAEEALAQARRDEQAALAQAKVAPQADAPATATAGVPSGAAPLAAEAVRSSKQTVDQARTKLAALELPIGWDSGTYCSGTGTALVVDCARRSSLTLLGWLLTALAATLGAPFWFDILNKVMVIRSTVKPYEKSKPEGSEDRQNADSLLAPVLRQLASAPAPAAQGAVAAQAQAAAAARQYDDEADLDGCELGHAPLTPDEELPPADGGMLR
jgi:hypothetical protein